MDASSQSPCSRHRGSKAPLVTARRTIGPAGAVPANHKPSQAAAGVRGGDGKLPLGFEANQGQTASQVRFLSRGEGYSLFLTPGEAVLTLRSGRARARPENHRLEVPRRPWKLPAPSVLRMQLQSSNTSADMKGLDELPGKSNYLIGNDSANWHTNVPNYRKVAEHEIYPGIDLVYYGTHRQLEYDFVIAPGADPRAIRLAFQGAKRLRIDSQGNLIASLGDGEVAFEKPVAYQQTPDGTKQPVTARYSIKGGRNVSFKVGAHDPAAHSSLTQPSPTRHTWAGA